MASSTIFLQCHKSDRGTHIVCPLSSSCVIFFLRYCQTKQFNVTFITTQVSKNDPASCSEVSLESLQGLEVSFTPWEAAPRAVRNVLLPSVHQPDASLVRAGLCVTLRHVIKAAHAEAPDRQLIDLLGFRQGSMRMCAEVSGWTKLCEVELPNSITQLLVSLKELGTQEKKNCYVEKTPCLTLPSDLLKLEGHFKKKCRIHNDDKKRRAELTLLKQILLDGSQPASDAHHKQNHQSSLGDTKTMTESSTSVKLNQNKSISSAIEALTLSPSSPAYYGGAADISRMKGAFIEQVHLSDSQLDTQHIVFLPHGVRRARLRKTLKIIPKDSMGKLGTKIVYENPALQHTSPQFELDSESTDSQNVDSENVDSQNVDAQRRVESPCLPAEIVDQLKYTDIEYLHTYSEGHELTLADLVLFVYIYNLLYHMKFEPSPVSAFLPSILHWASHMTSLFTVRNAGEGLAWDVAGMAAGLLGSGSQPRSDVQLVRFEVEQQEERQDEDEMELSRCAKMKHKAIKPEVHQALQKCQLAKIEAQPGSHPRGDNVKVDWGSLPDGVHPREGDVPEKRTVRKCQQLENLVTAVMAVAAPGDILVDFCCGGGHLGIVLAYLLPDCQVYLVENKEESLLKVCSRLKALSLKNVSLYQCNIDYFVGHFDVGTSLHACGSATDMVLQLCLDAGASFVICPCCYGSIHQTHLLAYPRSQSFQNSTLTYKDFLTLGHAADQTEFNIALEGQGRECMNLVDSDRAEFARESGYTVTLCSLQPLSCTPKNNLIVGSPGSPSLR